DLASVSEVDDNHDQAAVVDGVDDAIVANADSVRTLEPLQGAGPIGPRLGAELVDCGLHATADRLVELRERTQRLTGDLDRVAHSSTAPVSSSRTASSHGIVGSPASNTREPRAAQ